METNPVLKNITDYLIEEVSAEEEELVGASGGSRDDAADAKDPASSSDVTVETDEKLLKVGGAWCVRVCWSLHQGWLCVWSRCWTDCCSTCAWFTPWTTITSVSILLRTRCLIAVASSTSEDLYLWPGSRRPRVRAHKHRLL